eukprot:TRINITY_DN4858_c0_g2_i1.p1 TRINITY_DN4858_c0_g2~~TRINITY_DN4858_c0_g2_i1.p1  ORF type:complete len:543 (-),score=68.91 TRINITY_DN4858_c0_g2_i1:277-1905(-)
MTRQSSEESPTTGAVPRSVSQNGGPPSSEAQLLLEDRLANLAKAAATGLSSRRRWRLIIPTVALVCAISLVPMYLGFIDSRPISSGDTTDGFQAGDCIARPRRFNDTTKIMGVASKYFNASDPMVVEYAKLVNTYLAPFSALEGTGANGEEAGDSILPETIRHLSRTFVVMSCCGHIRIVNSVVYYRFGGFYHVSYRLLRFLQSMKLIQDAIEKFQLTNFNTEFILNTCDHPMSLYSSRWAGRAGFPIMSPFASDDTMDIPIPDALDLSPSYTPDLSQQIPWGDKTPLAVFRGATTNFNIRAGNYGSSPRVRLHRLADVHPQLLDARIARWSHIEEEEYTALAKEGVQRGDTMNFTAFNQFKYQIVADGGAGSCRVCGVLMSNQLVIRQDTPLREYHEPLLQENTHMLGTSRTFTDLPAVIKWAQTHDEQVTQMVKQASELAAYTCSWKGRMLYWGILLVKYTKLLKDAHAIQAPTNICTDKPLLTSPEKMLAEGVGCEDKDVDAKQVPCTFFCTKKGIPEEKFIWLHGDTLKDVERVGPGQ